MIEAKHYQCEDMCLKITHGLLTSCFCASPCRFGRKPVFFFTMVLQSVTALIQAASVSWVMFCVLNCLKGLGQVSNYGTSLILGETGSTCTSIGLKRVPTSISIPASSWTSEFNMSADSLIYMFMFSLILTVCLCSSSSSGSEMLGPSARIKFSLLAQGVCYGIGYALLPLFAFFIRSWRMLLVASAIPGLIYIPMWW